MKPLFSSPLSLLCLLLAGCGADPKPPPPAPAAKLKVPLSGDPAAYAGSKRCAECHAAEYEKWKNSHHALAEQDVPPEVIAEAFAPGKPFQHASQQTTPLLEDGKPVLIADGLGGKDEKHRVSHVIGVYPLLQFLVHGTGNRLQATEACWDPTRKEWFNVYGTEDRFAGEWGHWTGRGMNWNSMCAYCHNTRLQKGYDAGKDDYVTTRVERGVGCEACHGAMEDHSEWQEKNKGLKGDPTLGRVPRSAMLDLCASCHARRGELDGDFLPGHNFLDHFNPGIVDQANLWYPDGQNLDEDFEWAAFTGSRMHAAGVTCANCHDLHSGKRLIADNMLCMQCHMTGALKAPVIDPLQHTFHKPDSTGSDCTTCHMPLTTYMQRHPRHDHGFTSPDPLLTIELGIPNACNRCHTDKTPEWSLGFVEKWYGEKMNKRPRARTRAIAAARRGDPAARDGLLAVLESPAETPYWKAVAAGMLEPWVHEEAVLPALTRAAASTNALVRAHALRALAPLAESGHPAALAQATQSVRDPVRLVRYHAAWALRGRLPEGDPALRELRQTLAHNADQPTGQVQLGLAALARGKPEEALRHYSRAVAWDARSPGVRHDFAVILSMIGRNEEARQQMQTAVQLEPGSAEYRFKLALSAAGTGDSAAALAGLEETVKLDPGHARAWHNLGLARAQAGQLPAAIDALGKAEELSPSDPDPCYARATIHLRAGDPAAARAAAQKALQRAPGHPASTELLRSIP